MTGKKTATRCPAIRAKVARLLNERNEMINSTPPLTDWALNRIAELGLNGVDYWMYSNYEQRDVRYEIFGNEICREELEDSRGRIRLWWTLRDDEGSIVYMCKTFEDLIHEMMCDSAKFAGCYWNV